MPDAVISQTEETEAFFRMAAYSRPFAAATAATVSLTTSVSPPAAPFSTSYLYTPPAVLYAYSVLPSAAMPPTPSATCAVLPPYSQYSTPSFKRKSAPPATAYPSAPSETRMPFPPLRSNLYVSDVPPAYRL